MLGCTLAKALCTLAQPCCIDEVSSCRLAVPQLRLLHCVPDVDVSSGRSASAADQQPASHDTAGRVLQHKPLLCVLSTISYRQYKLLQAKIMCRRKRLVYFTSDVYRLDKVGHLMQRLGNSA